MVSRRLIRVGVIVVCVAIVAAIVLALGVGRTLDAVSEAGAAAFVSVGVLTFAFLTAQALAWAALNAAIGHRVPLRTLIAASLVGMAGNIVTPSAYLGGEPLKVIYVGHAARLPYHEVAGTVLLSKYMEATSFILFFSVSAVVTAVGYRDQLFGPYLALGVAVLAISAALLALGVAMWVSLARRWRPLTRLVRWLCRIPFLSRRLRQRRERVRKMETQVGHVFWEEAPAARKAFAALMASHVMMFLKPPAFFYLGTGMALDFKELCLLFVIGQMILALQVTPSGVGTLDGGLLGAFVLMGLDTSEDLAKCMAFLLCLRLWDLAAVGIGGILGARRGARILSAGLVAASPRAVSEPPRVAQ